jgi:hypothetical protein
MCWTLPFTSHMKGEQVLSSLGMPWGWCAWAGCVAGCGLCQLWQRLAKAPHSSNLCQGSRDVMLVAFDSFLCTQS